MPKPKLPKPEEYNPKFDPEYEAMLTFISAFPAHTLRQLSDARNAIAYTIGRISGLAGTTRYKLPEKLREELREIARQLSARSGVSAGPPLEMPIDEQRAYARQVLSPYFEHDAPERTQAAPEETGCPRCGGEKPEDPEDD